MDNSRKRDAKIDILKGICIILVVLGHCRFPFKDYIYLFHVSVFFIASGYLWNDKNSRDKKSILSYIGRKIKSLWVPYVTAQSFFIILNNVFIDLNIYTDNEMFLSMVSGGNNVLHHHMGTGETVWELVKNIFFLSSTQLGGALWFIRILFVISIGHMFLCAVISKTGHRKLWVTALIIILIAGAQIVDFYHNKMIKGTQPLFVSYLAYLIGIIIKKYNINDKLTKNKIPILIISFTVLWLINSFVRIRVNEGIISNVFFYITASVLGWCLLWTLSCMIKGKIGEILQYAGKNTMYIVVLHFLSFKIVSYFYLVVTNENILLLASFPVLDRAQYLWIIYVIAGVTVPLMFSYLWGKIKSLF